MRIHSKEYDSSLLILPVDVYKRQASAISDVVSKTKWDSGKQRGGYSWHTTGSVKTMTSFKSAQLIANSNDADKVIFLTDRI